MSEIKIDAKNDNSEMTVGTSILVPMISEVKWTEESFRYGQKAHLIIKTDKASSCKAVIRIRSNDWATSHMDIVDVTQALTDDEGNEFEGVKYNYKSSVDSLVAGALNESEVFADVWLIKMN